MEALIINMLQTVKNETIDNQDVSQRSGCSACKMER